MAELEIASITALHRLWRRLPIRGRRRLLERAASFIAPTISPVPPKSNCPGIAVGGELSRASGLGQGARLMLQVLQALGMPAWPVDVGSLLPAHTPDLRVVSQTPPPHVPLVLHVNPPLLPLVLFRLRKQVRKRRIIGYWSWELPTIPPDWEKSGRLIHELWVPSNFTATALESVAPGRVHVIPHPVALAPPTPAPLDRSAFGLPEDAIVVLVCFNLASSLERKNPIAAINAFRAAFGNRRDRLLVVKIGNPHHFPHDFDTIIQAIADTPNIRLDTRMLSSADLSALMVNCDIVLSLHRSEGFGLVLAESMLLGKPVVATGWSGNLDFMDAKSAALVDYHLIATHDAREVYSNSYWAEPDMQQAVTHLRKLADNSELRASIGTQARRTATARLGPEPLIAALQRITHLS